MMEKFPKYTSKEEAEDIDNSPESNVETEKTLDPDSILESERGFITKFRGKTKNIARGMLVMSTLAIAVGCFERTNSEDLDSGDNKVTEEVEKIGHSDRWAQIEENREKARKEIERAEEIAKSMGIELGDTSNYNSLNDYFEFSGGGSVEFSAGGVPTRINGQEVPEDLHTDDERTRIETANRLSGLLSGDINFSDIEPDLDDKETNKADEQSVDRNSAILKSRPVDLTDY